MSEQTYIDLFESGAISSSAFHHADHVRLAFCYLTQYSPPEALQRFSTALQRFAQANGKENLYNETITWAYLLLIHERMERCNAAQSWEAVAAANPDFLPRKNSLPFDCRRASESKSTMFSSTRHASTISFFRPFRKWASASNRANQRCCIARRLFERGGVRRGKSKSFSR